MMSGSAGGAMGGNGRPVGAGTGGGVEVGRGMPRAGSEVSRKSERTVPYHVERQSGLG